MQSYSLYLLQCVAACCSVLQRVATCRTQWTFGECVPAAPTSARCSIHYVQFLLNLLRTNTTPFTIQICYSIYYVQIRLHSLYKFATQFTTYEYDSIHFTNLLLNSLYNPHIHYTNLLLNLLYNPHIHYTNLLLNLLRTNTTSFTIQICYSIHYITPFTACSLFPGKISFFSVETHKVSPPKWGGGARFTTQALS